MKQRVIPLVIIAMSLFWINWGLFRYGLWFDGGPGGGFMPVFSGSLALLFAGILLFKPNRLAAVVPPSVFIPLVMALAALTLSMLTGLLPALWLMLFIWLWKLERYSLRKSLLVSVIPMLVVYGIFCLWLKVPFPSGVFGA